MARIPRRKFLAQYGGGALAVKISGIAGILASGRAPAFAQGTTLHWLRVNDFVPASDAFLRKELLPEAEKALGLKINLETINGNDVQPRITAGIQTSAGPDIDQRLQQLGAALCRERRRRQRRGRRDRQGARRLLRSVDRASKK